MEKLTPQVKNVVETVTKFGKTAEAFNYINRGHDFETLLEHTPQIAEMVKSQKAAEGSRMTFAARDDLSTDPILGDRTDGSDGPVSEETKSFVGRWALRGMMTIFASIPVLLAVDVTNHAIIPFFTKIALFIGAHAVTFGALGAVVLAGTFTVLMIRLLRGVKGRDK